MPTFVKAHPELAAAVRKAGGQIVRNGSKPWAEFYGPDAAERAKQVTEVYQQLYGHKCDGMRPWRPDQKFDYTIRLD